MIFTAFPDDYILQSEEILYPIFPYLSNFVLNLLPPNFEKNIVIDIGGGTGQWLEELVESEFKCGILLDIDYDMISHAYKTRKNKYKMLFINGNVECIPIKSNICNLVVSRNSMHLWDNLDVAWQEIARILKIGGYVFIGRGYGPNIPNDVREQVKSARKKFKTSSTQSIQLLNEINSNFQSEITTLDNNLQTSESSEEKESPPIEIVKEIANKYGITCLQIIPDNKSWWFFGVKL